MTAPKMPAEWTCDPKHVEYLGRDTDAEYWRVRFDVVEVRRGAARWLCTMAAWPLYRQIHAVA